MIPSPMQPGEQRLGPADDGPADDVDRVFARLTQLPPPRDFANNVLLAVQRVQVRQLGPWQIGWAIAELAAVLVLALLAYTTGQALVGGGALALIFAVAADTEVLQLVPGETLLTLAESIPWLELLGVVVMVAVVAACARRLARALAEPPLPTGSGAA
jgi:hypothetical protein